MAIVSRSARRREQIELAADLRRSEVPVARIAATLRERYGLNARLAMRMAKGWSQAETAEAWNGRWPDDTKTFKNVSYWERWPEPTGHAPSLAVLDRLAQLYGCAAADLVAGWGEHGVEGSETRQAEPESLAWQVRNLDLNELTRATADWAGHLPVPERRALLLKLSTAAALAADSVGHESVPHRRTSTGARSLVGRWASAYHYRSSSRGQEFDGRHVVELDLDHGRLVGRSTPQPSGSELELTLSVEGSLVTGSWTERTSPTGHYRAATFHGLIQLVVDPTGHSMSGKWLGIGKRYAINSGAWRLDRVPPS